MYVLSINITTTIGAWLGWAQLFSGLESVYLFSESELALLVSRMGGDHIAPPGKLELA